MAYTITAKNQMVRALRNVGPTLSITHGGLFQSDPGKAATAVAATGIFTSAAHGYNAGDLVLLTAVTGGAGLPFQNTDDTTAETLPLFVVNPTTNTFQLSQMPGGSALTWTTDISAATATRLVELATAGYARQAVAWNPEVAGAIAMSNPVTFTVAGATVDHVGFFSASSAGTLMALVKVTPPEVFGSSGNFNVSTAVLDLNS